MSKISEFVRKTKEEYGITSDTQSAAARSRSGTDQIAQKVWFAKMHKGMTKNGRKIPGENGSGAGKIRQKETDDVKITQKRKNMRAKIE